VGVCRGLVRDRFGLHLMCCLFTCKWSLPVRGRKNLLDKCLFSKPDVADGGVKSFMITVVGCDHEVAAGDSGWCWDMVFSSWGSLT